MNLLKWTFATWVGRFYAELGGLDMLALTGGIGENDIAVHAETCSGFGALWIPLDSTQKHVQANPAFRLSILPSSCA